METAGDESAVNSNLVESTPSAAEAANNEANEGMDAADNGDNPTSLGELGVLTDDAPMSLNLAVGPPSPLTGCYLLIIIGEPHSNEHKDIIIQRILKGKKSFINHGKIFFHAPPTSVLCRKIHSIINSQIELFHISYSWRHFSTVFNYIFSIFSFETLCYILTFELFIAV